MGKNGSKKRLHRGNGIAPMTGELSKCVKKQLRELVYVAHEKALQDSLATLGQHFDRWRRSEIDAIKFADLITTPLDNEVAV